MRADVASVSHLVVVCTSGLQQVPGIPNSPTARNCSFAQPAGRPSEAGLFGCMYGAVETPPERVVPVVHRVLTLESLQWISSLSFFDAAGTSVLSVFSSKGSMDV